MHKPADRPPGTVGEHPRSPHPGRAGVLKNDEELREPVTRGPPEPPPRLRAARSLWARGPEIRAGGIIRARRGSLTAPAAADPWPQGPDPDSPAIPADKGHDSAARHALLVERPLARCRGLHPQCRPPGPDLPRPQPAEARRADPAPSRDAPGRYPDDPPPSQQATLPVCFKPEVRIVQDRLRAARAASRDRRSPGLRAL